MPFKLLTYVLLLKLVIYILADNIEIFKQMELVLTQVLTNLSKN